MIKPITGVLLAMIASSLGSILAATQQPLAMIAAEPFTDWVNLMNTVGIPWFLVFGGVFCVWRFGKMMFKTVWPTVKEYLEAQRESSQQATEAFKIMPGLLKEQTDSLNAQLNLIQELRSQHDDPNAPFSAIRLERAVSHALVAFEDHLNENIQDAKDSLKDARQELRPRL